MSASGSNAGFVCVCVQKGVEFNIVDHKLHRANKDRELHEELEKLTNSGPSQYAYQLGGGCRIMQGSDMQHPIHIAAWGESVAAFEGTLNNLSELIKAFPETYTTTTASAVPAAEAPAGKAAEAQAAEEPAISNQNPAELLCIMYASIGQELLKLLRGHFSFCLYHAKTGRVLAARDGSGDIPLYQGMSDAESLVISSSSAFTTSCHDVKEFLPGHFKYGWYAEPRKFSSSTLNHHHYGHTNYAAHGSDRHSGNGSSSRKSMDATQHYQARRASMDVANKPKTAEKKKKSPVSSTNTSEDGNWQTVSARRRNSVEARPAGFVAPGTTPPGSRKGAAFKPAGRKSIDSAASNRMANGKAAATQPATTTPPARQTGFKWDINAPVFSPDSCRTTPAATSAGGAVATAN